MRTTLDIDDDLHAAAKDLARAEGKSLGAVVSGLMRRAILGSKDTAGLREAQATFDSGAWPVLPERGGVIVGPSVIAEVQDALDREDMAAALGKVEIRRKAGGRTKAK